MVLTPFLNKCIALTVLSEFGYIPRFSEINTKLWDRKRDTIWRIPLRAPAGYKDMWHALFFKLDMILSIWSGLTLRNRGALAIYCVLCGNPHVDWKELEVSGPKMYRIDLAYQLCPDFLCSDSDTW